MGNFKKFFISFTVLVTIFCMFACKEESGAPQTEKLGLQWSEKAPNSMTWDKAKQYCENLNEDGHNDWRLPNIDELRTLIKTPETISGGKCPISEKAGKLARQDFTEDCENSNKLGDTAWFWSSSILSDYSDTAWFIDFGKGRLLNSLKDNTSSVRCVRGGQTTTKSADSINKKEESLQKSEPTDKKELIKIGNLYWSNKAADRMNWNDAVNYCKNLDEGGYKDWKLPNIDELRALIQNHPGTQTGGSCPISERSKKETEDCRGRRGSNFSKLGDTGLFWSSSTHPDCYCASIVSFGDGGVGGGLYKSNKYYVRCVKEERTNTKSADSTHKKAHKQIGNLQWSNISPNIIEGRHAEIYCQKLREGGYSDWRLPNIDELRTLIKNCPGTESSGMCRISEKNDCLSESCYSKSCQSCAKKMDDFNNYLIHKDGYSKLGDGKDILLWSSSEVFGKEYMAWYVSFFAGGISGSALVNALRIRCVRNTK